MSKELEKIISQMSSASTFKTLINKELVKRSEVVVKEVKKNLNEAKKGTST